MVWVLALSGQLGGVVNSVGCYVNINYVLVDIKRASTIILGYKSNFYYLLIIIVRY
jgi:hypothetical protein